MDNPGPAARGTAIRGTVNSGRRATGRSSGRIIHEV